MKQEQRVVHNRGLSQILFATPWSVRSVFKHVIVACYIAFITVIIFNLNAFKDIMENATHNNSNNVSGALSIVDTLKIYSPQIVWDVLLIFLEIRLLKRTLKMIQVSNRNMIAFLPFAILTLGFAAFVAIFFPNWIVSKIDPKEGWLSGFKHLSVFMYIYISVPGITILWSIANAINERRISPFVTRANIFTTINMVIWLFTIGCGAAMAQMLFLDANPIPFDYHSPLQMFLMVAGVLLLIITIVSSLLSQRDMRRKTNYKFFNKNVEQAIRVAIIVPLAIWLCSSFIHMRGNWMEYVFIALIAIVSVITIAYAFIRKTETGSPRVFMVVTSLMFTIIWMLKFFFEYFWNFQVTSMFTLPVAMIGTSIVVSVIYWKSPMTSKFVSFLSSRFIKTLWIIVVASWGVSLIPTSLISIKKVADILTTLSESLNIILMALPILLLTVSILYWYMTQWKIKSHMSYKAKKKHINKKKVNKKEARNA